MKLMKNTKKISKLNKYKEPYILINLIFAGIIILIFIYSGIFSESNEHPIKCVHFEETGISCETCGLSRSFSEIVRFDLESAKDFNRNGIPLFLFFLTQFFMRIIFSLVYFKKWGNQKLIIIADTIFSIILFLIAFQNLILK